MRFGEWYLGPKYMPFYSGMKTTKRECKLARHGDRKWLYFWDAGMIDLATTEFFECGSRSSRAPWHLQHPGHFVIRATDALVDGIGEDAKRRVGCGEHE